jgi:hypothetical protein
MRCLATLSDDVMDVKAEGSRQEGRAVRFQKNIHVGDRSAVIIDSQERDSFFDILLDGGFPGSTHGRNS